MKHRLRKTAHLPTLILSLFLVHVSSCMKDNCKDTACQNGGVCVDGNCSCASGYEGGLCEKIWNGKFTGYWKNRQVRVDSLGSNASVATDFIRIRSNGVANIFLVDHLEGTDSVVCEITGVTSFKFNPQYRSDSAFFIESGQGNLDTVTGTVTAGYSFRLNGRRYSASMMWTLPGRADKIMQDVSPEH